LTLERGAGNPTHMSRILRTRFVIAVHDLQKSAAFYRDVLGFSVHSIPDPGFLFYTSGACTIWAGLCPGALPPAELGDHSYFAYLEIDDIDSFYASVRDKGATICKTIRDEPWSMREFGVVTADGHRIMFASQLQ
jgi:catechol 2,3-dioxygenase-like lactoylglutathione lyase family enzyme